MTPHPYPPEFIEALLETAERTNDTDPLAKEFAAQLADLIASPPSQTGGELMLELVPKLTWMIKRAGGWFYGPGLNIKIEGVKKLLQIGKMLQLVYEGQFPPNWTEKAAPRRRFFSAGSLVKTC